MSGTCRQRLLVQWSARERHPDELEWSRDDRTQALLDRLQKPRARTALLPQTALLSASEYSPSFAPLNRSVGGCKKCALESPKCFLPELPAHGYSKAHFQEGTNDRNGSKAVTTRLIFAPDPDLTSGPGFSSVSSAFKSGI